MGSKALTDQDGAEDTGCRRDGGFMQFPNGGLPVAGAVIS